MTWMIQGIPYFRKPPNSIMVSLLSFPKVQHHGPNTSPELLRSRRHRGHQPRRFRYAAGSRCTSKLTMSRSNQRWGELRMFQTRSNSQIHFVQSDVTWSKHVKTWWSSIDSIESSQRVYKFPSKHSSIDDHPPIWVHQVSTCRTNMNMSDLSDVTSKETSKNWPIKAWMWPVQFDDLPIKNGDFLIFHGSVTLPKGSIFQRMLFWLNFGVH